MIVTVTPNTGLDHVLILDRLRPGARNQALSRSVCMGGKGTDVSLILGQLGVSSLATGFAAGANCAAMVRMLEEVGVETAFVTVAGETRVNTVLYERDTGTHTTVCAEGLKVVESDWKTLTATLAERVGRGDVVIFAGSLPEGSPVDAYAPLIRSANAAGARTILDSSGAYLAAGLRGEPWAVKPNREELEGMTSPPWPPSPARGGGDSTVGSRSCSPSPLRGGGWGERLSPAAASALDTLLASGVTRVVASLSADGLIAVEGDTTWIAEAIPVEAQNPAGAGDAVVAAMALGVVEGWDLERTLREAVALATAVVVTPGTAVCDVTRVPEFRRRAVVRRVESVGAS
jgi:tagatose 6-phosphate kinase